MLRKVMQLLLLAVIVFGGTTAARAQNPWLLKVDATTLYSGNQFRGMIYHGGQRYTGLSLRVYSYNPNMLPQAYDVVTDNNGRFAVPMPIVRFGTPPIVDMVRVTITSGLYTGQEYVNQVTLKPAEVFAFQFNPLSVIGGVEPSTGFVLLNGVALGTTAYIWDGTGGGYMYASVPVPDGATSVSFSMPTPAVKELTDVTRNASTYTGNTAGPWQTVTLEPIPIQNLTLSSTTVRGGAKVTATITMTSPVQVPLTIATSSTNTAVATTPASVKLSSGTVAYQFPVTTYRVLSQQKIAIRATLGGRTISTTLTVNP